LARIRIIDEWLRSPVAPPSRYRAVMVVAESWSEQRVLMRAFASCGDQTRPTIVLHGIVLAIGPAGLEPHGEWGIHVEPPVDGRAQELRTELELAARRLAGSKGNPPRLADEVSRFENKATHLWAPGTPPDVPAGAPPTRMGHGYYEPAELVARTGRPMLVEGNPQPGFAPPDRQTVLAPPHAPPSDGRSRTGTIPMAPLFGGLAASATAETSTESVGSRTRPGFLPPPMPGPRTGRPMLVEGNPQPALAPPDRQTALAPPHTIPPPDGRSRTGTIPMAPLFGGLGGTASATAETSTESVGSRTRPGFLPPPPPARASSMSIPPVPAAPPAASTQLTFASLVGRTMPLGLQLTQLERDVLDALGRAPLTADEIGRIVGAADPVPWMEHLMHKLAQMGLDMVATGVARTGEPTYLLRR